MKFLILIILFTSFTSSCQRDEKEIGEDELDLQREEEYKPGDFSEKEFELKKK